jgi:two-component system, OmpR family, response regulator CpxR
LPPYVGDDRYYVKGADGARKMLARFESNRMAKWTGAAPKRICALAIDDDVELGELLREALAEHGVDVELAHDARHGLARALSGDHDIVLLDVMLPMFDGFELLRLFRRQRDVPVIMLTAKTTQTDQVIGLNAGADDFLPKPFGVDLLVARIRAVLRRSRNLAGESGPLEVGPLRLLLGSREILVDGTPIELTSVEYSVLEYLAQSAGRVVPKNELTLAIFQRKATSLDRAVDTHIYNLRKKLGGHADLIATIRGIGYLFRASNETDEQS